jgi:hypothetical protein
MMEANVKMGNLKIIQRFLTHVKILIHRMVTASFLQLYNTRSD